MDIRVGEFIFSMDQSLLVYKTDNPVQSSLLSSLILNQYKVLSLDQL